jgi:hypothetical protein
LNPRPDFLTPLRSPTVRGPPLPPARSGRSRTAKIFRWAVTQIVTRIFDANEIMGPILRCYVELPKPGLQNFHFFRFMLFEELKHGWKCYLRNWKLLKILFEEFKFAEIQFEVLKHGWKILFDELEHCRNKYNLRNCKSVEGMEKFAEIKHEEWKKMRKMQ